MSFTLRPYQERAVEKALVTFTKDRPFIIQAATGAGKSLIIAELCHRLNCPVLVLQPSRELVTQNYAKLLSYGVDDIKIYSAGLNSKEIGKYTYATIQSIFRKPELFAHFEYVIIDEADLVNPKALQGMYATFLAAIGCKKVCGLTATPYRIVQKYTQDPRGFLTSTAYLSMVTRIGHPTFWSGGIVYKVETDRLIEHGYLCPIKYHVADVDISDLRVNSTGADYTEDSLEVFWNDARLRALAEVIMGIDKSCKRNLIFCSSIRQASRALHILTSAGLSAEMVTGETPAKEREAIVKEFREGKIRHLLNCMVFQVGFDVPELDSIVITRPTMSLRLYYQMVGRGVRLDPHNNQKILHVHDLGGVVDRLGKVETIKITKEDDGFRDRVESEVGVLTGRPLFSYTIPKKSMV